MGRVRFNIQKTPPIASLPTNPQSAWVHGFTHAIQASERIINEMLPFMDSTSKALVIQRHHEFFEEKTIPKLSPKAKPRTKHTLCGCPKKFIEKAFEQNYFICTLCGMKGK